MYIQDLYEFILKRIQAVLEANGNAINKEYSKQNVFIILSKSYICKHYNYQNESCMILAEYIGIFANMRLFINQCKKATLQFLFYSDCQINCLFFNNIHKPITSKDQQYFLSLPFPSNNTSNKARNDE